MAYEAQETESSISQGETGIYTLTGSDLEIIRNLELSKEYYMRELDTMSRGNAIEQLSSLLSSMSIFMEKYGFRDYLLSEEVDGFTFYYVKNVIPATGGNIQLLRRGCEIAFTIWESVLKSLGVGLPTSTFRSKAKNGREPLQSR